MLFNSFSFLAFFAAICVAYYAIPSRVRWVLLVAASLYFYAAFKPVFVVLLLGITLVAYSGGRVLGTVADQRRRKALLALSVVLVLGALFVFKYYDFFVASLTALIARIGLLSAVPVLPRLELVVAAGLSFYTFSCVSYLVDVYAGRMAPERHLGHFALYVAFFPKLLAGPIERARPFLAQVTRPVAFNGPAVISGLQLMLWGLFKKVVIADRLAVIVNSAYAQPAFASPADLVLGTYFFAFQLYCDFSGYSDIAIGGAKVLGFDLMENFRRPYFSTSVREFWAQRWHVSLSSWFRDYMYIPMGGSRRSRPRAYFNVMAVFLVSGLWHGANWTFVIWGGLNGFYQVVSLIGKGLRDRVVTVSRLPGAIRPVLGALLTFHLILITWVFFRAASVSDAVTVFTRVVRSADSLPRLLWARVTTPEVLLLLGLIAVLLVVEAFDEKRPFWEQIRRRPVFVRWAVYYAMLFGLIVFGTWNFQQFVYMQF